MRSAASIILSALCVFLFACSTMQTGNDFAAGRRALIVGDDQAALRFFQSAAESNPTLHTPPAVLRGKVFGATSAAPSI